MRVWTLLLALILLARTSSAQSTASMDDVLAELRAYAQAQFGQSGVPGMAYAVVKDDQIIDAQAFGIRDTTTGAPVDINTIFEIGSCSKAFTAALMAIAVDEGRVKWEDPVRDYLPDFRMYSRHTTREFQVVDLMSQRSGMPEHSLDVMSFLHFPAARILRGVRYVKPITSFRSAYAYQNTLYLAAGFVIEHVFGASWAELAQRRIFDPLGMSRTTADSEASFDGNVARGNVVLPDGTLWAVPDNWALRDFLAIYLPTGGVRSTVIDLTRWIRLQLGLGAFNGQRLISQSGIIANWTPRIEVELSADQNLAYANGWIYQTMAPGPIVWHNGGTLSMHSIVGLIPAANLGIAVLTNTADNSIPENLLNKLYRLYYAQQPTALAGLPRENAWPILDRQLAAEWPAASGERGTKSAVRLMRMVGVYRNHAVGTVRVVRRGGQLYLYIGPRRARCSLRPKGGNTFGLLLPDYPNELGDVEFILPEGTGPAQRMMVQAFREAQNGAFRRISHD